MGLMLTSLYRKLFNKKQHRIIMLGLDGAGKTTILYRLKFTQHMITTIPTIGFNVEIINYKNMNFVIWDVGGQNNIRRLWRYYYPKSNGIIFVIDSNDEARMEEVKSELQNLLEEYELRDAALLILANKQDLSTSMTMEKIRDSLQINKLTDRKWHIQATSALKNTGLYEGLDWLSKQFA